MTVKNGVVYGDALSAQEKKRIVMQKKKDRKAKKVRKSAQQTIPYVEMCRDGICKVNSRLYTKSIAFEDINYQLAQKTYDDVFHHVITRGPHKGEVRGFAWAGMCAVNRNCKIPPVRKYNAALSPDTVSYVGIAQDEPKRLARLDGITKVSLLGNVYGVCCPVSFSTECTEFSRLRKMKSATL